MSVNRRTFMQTVGLGAGAVCLGPSLPRAWAQGAPVLPRRFVFVIEGNGIEPGKFLTPAVRAAIEAQATGSLLCQWAIHCNDDWDASDQTPLEPAMNRQYGHDVPLVIEEGPLSSAGTLGALAAGEWGPSLEAKSAVVLGLSSLITGGGHFTYGGALSCTRCSPGAPGGQSIDALLAGLPSVRGLTPFDALRIGIGNTEKSIVHITSSYGPGRPAAVILDPGAAHDYAFGSVNSPASIQAFNKRSRLLDFGQRNAVRRIATFKGPEAARRKLVRYKKSLDDLLVRQSRLHAMGDQLRAVMPVAPHYPRGFLKVPHLARLADQFQVATGALLGSLTNVVVIASGSGGYSFFDIGYEGLPSWNGQTPARHNLLHERPDRPGHHRIVYEATARHVELIAQMARTLDAVPEGNGTMLDNTAIIYMSDNGEQHHSFAEEWPMLLVGGGNMGLQTGGRTIVYPRVGRPQNRQVSNLFNTLGYCAGQPLDDFGDEGATRVARGPLPELWTPPG